MAIMMSSGDDMVMATLLSLLLALLRCTVLVAFAPLSFIVNVGSFFFSAIITSVGV